MRIAVAGAMLGPCPTIVTTSTVSPASSVLRTRTLRESDDASDSVVNK
jgi:hypothetical protein